MPTDEWEGGRPRVERAQRARQPNCENSRVQVLMEEFVPIHCPYHCTPLFVLWMSFSGMDRAFLDLHYYDACLEAFVFRDDGYVFAREALYVLNTLF